MIESNREPIGEVNTRDINIKLLDIDNKRSLRELLEYVSNLSPEDLFILDYVLDKTEKFNVHAHENEKIGMLIKIYRLSYDLNIKTRIVNMLKSLDRNRVQNVLEENLENPDPHIRMDAEEILHRLKTIN
jgi:hypothetical protein